MKVLNVEHSSEKPLKTAFWWRVYCCTEPGFCKVTIWKKNKYLMGRSVNETKYFLEGGRRHCITTVFKKNHLSKTLWMPTNTNRDSCRETGKSLSSRKWASDSLLRTVVHLALQTNLCIFQDAFWHWTPQKWTFLQPLHILKSPRNASVVLHPSHIWEEWCVHVSNGFLNIWAAYT